MTSGRNVYLNMKTIYQAKAILLKRFPLSEMLAAEEVPTPDAVGRVLAEPAFARFSAPGFPVAAMDGIAVAAEQTFGAAEDQPLTLAVGETAFFVNTGHVLPQHTNAVIMIEHVQVVDDNRVTIEAPVFPWQNVRRVGEDIVATELMFPSNHLVTPYCIGALLTGGVFSVTVRKRPKGLVIPTGSELVDWKKLGQNPPGPGQVIESNSYVLEKLIEDWGGVSDRNPFIEDDVSQIRSAVQEAVREDYQFVLIAGGSSAGSADFSKKVVESLGEVLVHGVTMMPGKPVLIGDVQGKPVFGIPGYPVSAILAFEQFVGPLLQALQGLPGKKRETMMAVPIRKIPSRLGVEEFLRVKLGRVDDRMVATPLPRGAGSITTLTEADGILRIPGHVEGLAEGEPVSAELLRPRASLEKTIVGVGSHDNTLDLLADRIRQTGQGYILSSSHVGSLGGLTALKKGVCHFAGIHLLDEQDGSYNVSYIQRYLPDMPVKLVNLVHREQGLIVPKGNPKNIKGIADLTRPDIQFINRQAGSGTRILLDYRIRRQGLDPLQINGYRDEEFTHMAVAVAVLSGSADTGLGICAAARALDLDFIPVVTEQYDLAIPYRFFDTPMIQALLAIVRTGDFQQDVRGLGGYHTEKTGQVVAEFG